MKSGSGGKKRHGFILMAICLRDDGICTCTALWEITRSVQIRRAYSPERKNTTVGVYCFIVARWHNDGHPYLQLISSQCERILEPKGQTVMKLLVSLEATLSSKLTNT